MPRLGDKQGQQQHASAPSARVNRRNKANRSHLRLDTSTGDRMKTGAPRQPKNTKNAGELRQEVAEFIGGPWDGMRLTLIVSSDAPDRMRVVGQEYVRCILSGPEEEMRTY